VNTGFTAPLFEVEGLHATTLDGTPILLDQVGISHISFGVADVAGLADELIAKGYELAGPRESYTDSNGDIKSIYVRDPDGILVQFNRP